MHSARCDRLAKLLRADGAGSSRYLPTMDGRVGVDDFLAGGRQVEELYALAEDELRELPPEPKAKRAAALPTAYLLDVIERLLRRFVRFPADEDGATHGSVALALFVMHSWAIEAAQATPYMLVSRPRSGRGRRACLRCRARRPRARPGGQHDRGRRVPGDRAVGSRR